MLCCCSVTRSCLTLCNPMDYSMPGFPDLHYLPEFAQTHVPWVSDAFQSSRSLSPPSPALNLCQHHGLFQWVGSLHQVTKILALQFQLQSFQWVFWLISFRIDWFDLFAVQGTLKSILQNHSLKASALQCSAFFMVQFSHPYLTPGKTIALTIWTFVGKVTSVLFNTLARFCHSFSFKEQESFIFLAAVNITIYREFGAQENKVCHCFHCFRIYLPWRDGTGCHSLSFLNVEFYYKLLENRFYVRRTLWISSDQVKL